ncbi:hypothetical protein TBR22_A00520 [Luteitalea sp. TBR-22]|uniref:hypothetical protein n=1 Tax=Luteitalea sp. TBR-22 TaxID=2802971 RepID=UPI001AF7E741|nr:hypothetical protein [Luteitalea sp. TBR-22]BCS30852.1 hypothetical protein TBR22_A00520 [Luteitalea sp. TBR-22]
MLEADRLIASTDVELDALFRQATTLPLASFVNTGAHRIDVSRREIVNDARWKGFLPKGLPLDEVAARLSTGYAKRFWMQRARCLGETQYLDGRVNLKHVLEEVTLEQPVNDLDAGRYILLRYTDPVFEHIFYDTMKMVSTDVILYRGYTGQFPGGRRGWTAPLLRRYGFGQAGVDDHEALVRRATAVSRRHLLGRWRMDLVHGRQSVGVAHLTCSSSTRGPVESRLEPTDAGRGVLPPALVDHLTGPDLVAAAPELRRLDDDLLLGTWVTDLTGPYARLVLGGSLPLFRPTKDARGRRRFALHYMLTRDA